MKTIHRIMNSQRKIYQFSTINPFIALMAIGLFIVGLFWIAKGLLAIFAKIAPFVFVAAIIANYRVVLGYGKWLLDTLSRNPVFGVIAVIFSIIGFPLLSVFLLIKAINSRRSGKEERTNAFYRKKAEYTSFEEVDDDFLDLSDVKSKGESLSKDFGEVINK